MLQQAAEINGTSAQIHIDLIKLYVDLKQFDQAFSQLAEAEKLDIPIPDGLKKHIEKRRQAGAK